MNKFIKNVEAKKVMSLKDCVSAYDGKVNAFSLAERKTLVMKILSLGKGAEVPTHKGAGDVLVNVIEGKGSITIDDDIFELKVGESVLIPIDAPHSLKSIDGAFKVLVVQVRPE